MPPTPPVVSEDEDNGRGRQDKAESAISDDGDAGPRPENDTIHYLEEYDENDGRGRLVGACSKTPIPPTGRVRVLADVMRLSPEDRQWLVHQLSQRSSQWLGGFTIWTARGADAIREIALIATKGLADESKGRQRLRRCTDVKTAITAKRVEAIEKALGAGIDTLDAIYDHLKNDYADLILTGKRWGKDAKLIKPESLWRVIPPHLKKHIKRAKEAETANPSQG
jgi:hypothetical protein